MARILMTWEMGSGYGHIGPLLSLASPLRAAGHELTFAVRNPAIVRTLSGDPGIPILEAPANRRVTGDVVLRSYPEILLHTCFNLTADVATRVQGWRELFKRTEADLLIGEFSPTALLAARGTGLKCLSTGYGFVLPPDIRSLPNLRPWERVDSAALAQIEARVLEIMNTVLRTFGAPPLDYPAQLYPSESVALFTWRELDNYASVRSAADYLGPLVFGGGARPEWPAREGQRIFAYLRPFPTQEALLEALSDSGQPTLVHAPGIAPDLLNRHAGGNLRFTTGLVDIAKVAQECDLAILHGGHGILARMLLAGKPLLLLPLHLETLINANAVLALGAGLAAPLLKPEGMRLKLQRLLQEPHFARAAERFAERYATIDIEEIPLNFRKRVERLLAA